MQAERLDRNQWKQYTSLMADSGRFVDMLHGINWQDGLNLDVSNGKFQLIHYEKQKSYLASKKVANPPNCFCYDYKFELAIQLLKNCNNYVITY